MAGKMKCFFLLGCVWELVDINLWGTFESQTFYENLAQELNSTRGEQGKWTKERVFQMMSSALKQSGNKIVLMKAEEGNVMELPESQQLKLIEDSLDAFEEEEGQKMLPLEDIVRIVNSLRQIEQSGCVDDDVPQEISYIQQYPLIGLLMKNCSEGKEKQFLPILNSISEDFDEQCLTLDFVHQVGEKIMDRSVYGDIDAAENLARKAADFLVSSKIDAAVYALFDAYACVGAEIEKNDYWNFCKAYLLIYAKEWKGNESLIRNLLKIDEDSNFQTGIDLMKKLKGKRVFLATLYNESISE